MKFNTPKYGEVIVRPVMIDLDGTNLEEGIEVTGENVDTFEMVGYYDVEDMTIIDVTLLIDNNQ